MHKNVCVAAFGLLVLASSGWAQEKTYPLTVIGGARLMIAASVNGHPVQALLDSAAEATLVDGSFAQRLNLKRSSTVPAQGSGAASFNADLVAGVTLQALGLSLPNQTVAVVDLTDVGRRLLGRRVDVILGRELFDAARLCIDIDAGRIGVVNRDREPPGVRFPLRTEHGVETFPVRVEGVGPLQATFDLGNGSQVMVGSALAARLHLLTDGRKITAERGGGLGGAMSRQVIELRALEVGQQVYTDVPATIDQKPSASDVNIGISMLRNFLITTDFAQRAIWLRPKPESKRAR
jgi:predicted aspartyl protease